MGWRVVVCFLSLVISTGSASAESTCESLVAKLKIETNRVLSPTSKGFQIAGRYWLDQYSKALSLPRDETFDRDFERLVRSDLKFLKSELDVRLKKLRGLYRKAKHSVTPLELDFNLLERARQKLDEIDVNQMTPELWLQRLQWAARILDLGHFEEIRPGEIEGRVAFWQIDREELERLLDDPSSLEALPKSWPFYFSWIRPQSEVTYESFNRIGALPVFLFGLSSVPIWADGSNMIPSRFIDHDLSHTKAELSKALAQKQTKPAMRKALLEALERVEFELKRQKFGMSLPRGSREIFEAVYFFLWHEASYRPHPSEWKARLEGQRVQNLRSMVSRANGRDFGSFSSEGLAWAYDRFEDFIAQWSADFRH